MRPMFAACAMALTLAACGGPKIVDNHSRNVYTDADFIASVPALGVDATRARAQLLDTITAHCGVGLDAADDLVTYGPYRVQRIWMMPAACP